MRHDIIEQFKPVDDSKETAKRIADWSVCFLGDPMNKAHYWIRSAVPPIHMTIYEKLAENNRFMYLTSPRDFAKTTVDNLVFPLYCVYYELDPYIVLIGKIDSSGKKSLKNIKREIKHNPKLAEVYGNLSPDDSKESSWSAVEIRTRNGVYIRSIGMMGDIRGSIDAMYRPTRIIIDDPQAAKHMREPATLESHEDYFERDVIFSLDEEYGKLNFIGNLVGKACLLAKVIKDPRFVGVNFSALVDKDGKPNINGKSIWEKRHSTKSLYAERNHFSRDGKLHIFMLERQNVIPSEYDKNLKGYKFHKLRFERMHDQNVLTGDEYPDPVRVNTYLAVDPAFSDSETADERALVVFAKGRILQKTEYGKAYWFNCLWVLEYIFNHMQPDDIINSVLELHKKYYFDSVIIEAISGAQIYEPMMFKASVQDTFFSQFPFSPVMVKYQPQNKKDRILTGLQPKCKLGQLLIRDTMIELIDEMDNFEMKKSPHLLDAIETANRYTTECMAQFSHIDELQMKFIIEEEESRETPNLGFAPNSLESIFG